MKFIKRSERRNPKLTLILLDWSVRESFHLLHYLSKQDVPRDSFEVLVVEYYSRVSDAIRKFEDQVDTWVALEMPEDCYYHKHLMYNVGIVLSNSEICVICDSDAMVKEGFIRTIIESFDQDPEITLHLDQFRNNRTEFYPFNFPSFDDVLGKGCINNVKGKTAGILDTEDPIHARNYGACMCARRDALIEIGGADEHIDFLGHICGPYDLTFRLVNTGRREIWHQNEFMFHTWHPGQAGVDNYLGPHDGRHMSTTSLAALSSGRVRPLIENGAIRLLREHSEASSDAALHRLLRPENRSEWLSESVEMGTLIPRFDGGDLHIGLYRGFSIYTEPGVYYAHPALDRHHGRAGADRYGAYAEAPSVEQLKISISTVMPAQVQMGLRLSTVFVYASQVVSYGKTLIVHMARAALRIPFRVGRALRDFFSSFSRRVEQISTEGHFLTDAIGDLVTNLYYVGRTRDPACRVSDVVLLIEGARTEAYLKLLRHLRIVPKIMIVRVSTVDEVMRVFDQTERKGPGARVLISRTLYWRCYPIISNRKLRHALTVL